MAGTSRPDDMMSEINVTPFVDVMLVLLIIFMVTAPMMQQGEEVTLPAVDSKGIQTKEDPLVLTVDAGGNVWLGQAKVAPGFLGARLGEILSSDKDRKVLLKADATVPYGKVVAVMNAVRRAGVTQLGMLTQPVDPAGKGSRG